MKLGWCRQVEVTLLRLLPFVDDLALRKMLRNEKEVLVGSLCYMLAC